MPNEFIEIPIAWRPQVIEEIRRDREKSNQKLHKAGLSSTIWADEQKSSILHTKPASQWMEQEYGKPMPKRLFGDFWFEGELCILFADTNLGKSILAVQLGNNISQGTCLDPFANNMDAQTPVLYVDFELSSKQFQSRYFDNRFGSMPFGLTFYRAEFNPEADNPALYSTYEQFLATALEKAIQQTQAKVVIIDNITYMRSGTERAKVALPLMKQLKALKTRFGLSVLALAHTPKRPPGKLITVNDLQGSKMLINFADSAFAIGQAHTIPNGRYLKQIKQRNAKQLYHQDNVCLFHITKDMNCLQYQFDGYARERDLLLKPVKPERELLKLQAQQLRGQGLSYRDISAQLKIGLVTVNRLLV